jgi:hypothetical protein
MIVITLVLGALSFAAGRWTPGQRKAKRRNGSHNGAPTTEDEEPQKVLAAAVYQ